MEKILNSATTSIDAIYMYVYMYMYILCKYWATVCSVVLSVDKVKRNSQSSSKHEMFFVHASALLDPTTHDLDISFRVGQCIPSSSLINYTCTYSSYTSYNCNMLFPIGCTCSLTCSGVLEPPQLLVRLHSKINESGEEERGRREREREGGRGEK